jgi:hypothetical protein
VLCCVVLCCVVLCCVVLCCVVLCCVVLCCVVLYCYRCARKIQGWLCVRAAREETAASPDTRVNVLNQSAWTARHSATQTRILVHIVPALKVRIQWGCRRLALSGDGMSLLHIDASPDLCLAAVPCLLLQPSLPPFPMPLRP